MNMGNGGNYWHGKREMTEEEAVYCQTFHYIPNMDWPWIEDRPLQ
jgi:hypothetical protein